MTTTKHDDPKAKHDDEPKAPHAPEAKAKPRPDPSDEKAVAEWEAAEKAKAEAEAKAAHRAKVLNDLGARRRDVADQIAALRAQDENLEAQEQAVKGS